MDQDNTKGQDKRNWRERLGIGAQGNRDLPKISDDFRKEAAPAAPRPAAPVKAAPRAPVAAAPVRPAPMAPRANPKAIVPQSPVPSDKLAERLRSQREASTRLAEQRVQVAKQRAEAQAAMPAPAPQQPAPTMGGAKPKFTFAEEGEQAKAAAAKPVAPPPMVAKPQIMPARMPLGGAPTPPPVQPQPNAFQPRPAQPAYVPPQAPSYVPPQAPAGYPSGYNPQPVPPYRPIDPATGMPSQGGYVPPRNFGAPPAQQGYQAGPRLNVPPRMPVSPQGGYAPQQDYNPAARSLRPPEGRVTQAPLPASEYENEFYDEMPQPRGSRPTSTDYKQAYQEAEYGYEDEPPRSKAPWVLAGMLLLAIVIAIAGAWWWMNYGKQMMSGQSGTQNVPAVAAPETPAKVQPEQPAAAAQQPAAASPTKKQIYDRIVGDQEILGGEVTPPAEAPAAIPDPTPAPAGEGAAQPSNGSGEDAAPLPIPPPPGGAGDQQGSLAPGDDKQSAEVITPAAGESQAAVAAQDLPVPPKPASPPAPGELAQEVEKTRSLVEEPKVAEPAAAEPEESEAIADPAPAPVKKKPAAPVKKVASKAPEKNLGSKPVVLVPAKPAKAAAPKSVAEAPAANASGDAASGGLYGTEDITAPAAPAAQPVQDAPKKKKTLADLFAGNDDEPAAASDNDLPADAPAAPVAPKKPQAAAPPPAAKKPQAEAPTQVASGAGGYVVQLASFRSRDEASSEYSRLKAKHSQTLGRYSPIISEATVGGSTRYRLSVGRMESQAQANAVCSSLFAQGERDCLIKKQ